MYNVEFAKLPDGRLAVIINPDHVEGFTKGGTGENLSVARTDGQGAQVAPNFFIQVNAWKKQPKAGPKLVEVKNLLDK